MGYEDLTAGQRVRSSSAATHGLFGQVMGLVAVTIGFTALGAYVGRDLSGGWGIAAFVGALVCLIALNGASRRSEPLALTLLFAVGLLLGLVLGPGLAAYVSADPAAVWQAAGATALFIAALGSYGWATDRDLSGLARGLFWALLALIAFGIVALFVAIPGANVIYAVLGLVIFGGFTAFDFQRLRRAGMDAAVPIAASIFLDVLNVFQFFLLLFGGGGGSRD
ncbi:MAG TPA: Bax inhibitor-1 family protein [Baekduia sp.]